MDTLICNTCGETKPLSEFPVRKSQSRLGVRQPCTSCNNAKDRARYAEKPEYRARQLARTAARDAKRDNAAKRARAKELHSTEKLTDRWYFYAIKSRFGVTRDQYGEMYERSGGRCESCKEPFTKRPHLDHSHETDAVRGLLCGACNTSLGLQKDDPARLQGLINYITRFQCPTNIPEMCLTCKPA